MSTDTEGLVGFICCLPQKALEIKERRRLSPLDFGKPHKWIPFADSEQEAFELFSRSSQFPPSAATEETELAFLKVSFSMEQFRKFFLDHKLERASWALYAGDQFLSIPVKGWRFSDVLDLDAVGCLGYFLYAQKMDMHDWGIRALSKKYKQETGGKCFECGTEWGTTRWRGFCATCWNTYLMHTAA